MQFKGLTAELVIGLAAVVLLMAGCGPRGVAPASTSVPQSSAGAAAPASTPFLTFVEVQNDGAGGVEGLDHVWSLALSPDGRHLYTAGYRDDTVMVFGRDSRTGKLTFVEAQKEGVGGVEGLSGVLSVAVSPDGRNLYAGSYWDRAVVVFRRDAATGRLTLVGVLQDGIGGEYGLNGLRSVTVSPDGRHVYAAGYRGQAVAVFGRDSTTGGLTFVEKQKEGVGGVDGLEGANSVAVSPDGKHLYAAGLLDAAVAVFSRDSISGKLSFVEVQKNGTGPLAGLWEVFSVTVSPDGRHVYAAGFGDSAVVVFSRDSRTGRLTFVETRWDGIDGVDGLDGISAIAVSPDGKTVYGAGCLEDTLPVFRRDAATGRLVFVEVHREGAGGVSGLGGTRSVAVSPDGKHVYAAGTFGQSLAIFRTPSP